MNFFYNSFNCIQDMITPFNKSLNFRKCQPTISENLSHEQLSLQNFTESLFPLFQTVQYILQSFRFLT